MKKEIEEIKKICDKMEIDYKIIDDKNDLIFVSDGYEQNESSFGHETINFGSLSGMRQLYLAKKNESTKDIAMLLKLYTEKGLTTAKKELTFDDLFLSLIKKERKVDNDLLRGLKIKESSRWLVICVKYMKEPDENIKDILLRSLPRKAMIAIYNEKNVSTSLLAEISSEVEYSDMVQYVKGLYQVLESEFVEKINIGISPQIDDFDEVSDAVEYAKCAAVYGKLLTGKDSVYLYDELGIAKIVAISSDNTKKRIYREIINNSGIEFLDKELLKTIYVLYQNNLNISETARNLYIHRNTLNYRIEKIQRLTRLNLNCFDEAAFLRIILLFKNSLERKENN